MHFDHIHYSLPPPAPPRSTPSFPTHPNLCLFLSVPPIQSSLCCPCTPGHKVFNWSLMFSFETRSYCEPLVLLRVSLNSQPADFPLWTVSEADYIKALHRVNGPLASHPTVVELKGYHIGSGVSLTGYEFSPCDQQL